MAEYAALILAGGAGRRLGGADKAALRVGGRPLIDVVLAAAAEARPRVVVGPPRALPEGVLSVREDPPGGGPVTAVAAGMSLVPRDVPAVALLATDLPFLTATALQGLRAALTADAALTGDAALFVDRDGRRQMLCAVWRADSLRERLTALGPTDNLPLTRLYADATLTEIGSPDDPPPWYDCDTPDDLARARDDLTTGRASGAARTSSRQPAPSDERSRRT